MRRAGNETAEQEPRFQMLARRLAHRALLTVSIAAVVHVAVFGSEHAPGGNHAQPFAAILVAAILLAALAAFLEAALQGARRPSPITSPASAYPLGRGMALLRLAAGADAAYAAIEALEGHFGAAGMLRALACVLPASAAVAWLARIFSHATRAAGSRFAAYAKARGSRQAPAARLYSRSTLAFKTCALTATRAGRAPPRFA